MDDGSETYLQALRSNRAQSRNGGGSNRSVQEVKIGIPPVLESNRESTSIAILQANQHPTRNLEIPDHHYQVFQRSLLEHEFQKENAFISATLQRLQHGVYRDDKRLDQPGAYREGIQVTFVAVTFVFHPMNSVKRRFKRAQINIQAFRASGKPPRAAYNQPLRIVKFAPHVAYGRISTESLHWTFSLGATLGVSQPLTANVTPTSGFDKSKVIGTMLKIQGSSREAGGVESSKLVWSLEENDEQAAGLPREFTFVFLIEQPVAKAAFTLQIGIKPTFSNDIIKKLFFDDEYIARSGVLDEELGQRFSSDPFNFATMQGQFEDLVELPGIATNIQDLPPDLVATSPSASSADPSAVSTIVSTIRKLGK